MVNFDKIVIYKRKKDGSSDWLVEQSRPLSEHVDSEIALSKTVVDFKAMKNPDYVYMLTTEVVVINKTTHYFSYLEGDEQ